MSRRRVTYSFTPPTPIQKAEYALDRAREIHDLEEVELVQARAQLEAIRAGIGNQGGTEWTDEWFKRQERRVTRSRRKVQRLEAELARILADTEKNRLLDKARRYREKYAAAIGHGQGITFALAGMVERLRDLFSGGPAPPAMFSRKRKEIREAAEKLSGLTEAESEEVAVPPPPWLDGSAPESIYCIRQYLAVIEENWLVPLPVRLPVTEPVTVGEAAVTECHKCGAPLDPRP